LNEKAARNAEGGYTYPIHVLGRDENARAFSKEAVEQFGAKCLLTAVASGVTDLRFTYTGNLSPDQMVRLALKHQLQIVQCGVDVIFEPRPN
jgi:hypothetical protein